MSHISCLAIDVVDDFIGHAKSRHDIGLDIKIT
jgi:hypothetical protein